MSDQATPRSRRKAQTRQAILQTARQLIVAQGQDNLSIRALADRVNYTPSALYKYFKNKEALIDAVRADCFQSLNHQIAQRIQTATDVAEMLLVGGMTYIEYAKKHPQEYYLMFNMAPSHATSGEQRTLAMQMLLQIVEMGIGRGEIVVEPPYDAKAIAYHCWTTVHGIATLQMTVLRDDADEQDEATKFVELDRLVLQKVIDGFTVKSSTN